MVDLELQQKARNGCFEYFQQKIKCNIDIAHTVDEDNRTLFHLACLSQSLDLVELLFCRRILNSQDKNGDTPLHVATETGNCALISFLLEQGANANVKNENGEIPLHFHKGRVEVAQELLSYTADINCKNYLGKTPLMLAVASRATKVVALLVANGADINICDNKGNNALHLACYNQHEELALWLAKRGINKRMRNHENLLPAQCGIAS